MRSTRGRDGIMDALDDVIDRRPVVRRAPAGRSVAPRAEPRGTIWAATLDLMRIAVLILDAECCCVAANAAAEDLLAATRLIRISSGILVIDDQEARRQVASAVHAAAAD